jgi:hypothetical protein
MNTTCARPPFTLLLTTIAGPDRKRTPAVYQYRMVYRNPESVAGCRMVWEVSGGRTTYQVAVEKKENGEVAWHCTCPDAVYRGELTRHHVCKHVHGLLDCTLTEPPPPAQEQAVLAA